MKVTVVGSLNIDYIASVERLPAAGETVPAHGLVRRFGGKGANQALAAARQGAQIAMIGCVGADDEGRAYCRRLRAQRINSSGISTTRRALTGTALIAVDRSAENIIVVAAGANGELTPAAVRVCRQLVASADILLLQLEIPLRSVIEAIRIANRADVPVVLNPSPLRDGFPWGKCRLDTLIANAGEAQAIFGLVPETIAARLGAWRRSLARHRIDRLITTRGPKPTICLTATDYFQVPAFKVKPVDSVGAGDAFAGTFAARRVEGNDLITAVRYANCAGALATLKPGAQEAIPSRAATEKAMKEMQIVGFASRKGS